MLKFRQKSAEIRQKICKNHIFRKNPQTTAEGHPNAELIPWVTYPVAPGHLVQSTNQCLKIAIFGRKWALFEIFHSRKKCTQQKSRLYSRNNDRKLHISDYKHHRTL